MDETPKQDLPPQNGEAVKADPDLISLPRQTIGTPEVVAGFLMLLSLDFMGDVGWKMYEIIRAGGKFTDAAGMNYAATLTGLVFSLICGLALAVGAIGLVFFISFGRSWALWTVCLLPALLLLKIPAIYFSTSVSEQPPTDMFVKAMMFIWIAFTVCWLLAYVPGVRNYSPGARENFSRRSISIICALAVCLTLWFAPEWREFASRRLSMDPVYDQNPLLLISMFSVALIGFFTIGLAFGNKYGLIMFLLTVFFFMLDYLIYSGKNTGFKGIYGSGHASLFTVNYFPVLLVAAVGVLYGVRRWRTGASVLAGVLALLVVVVRIEVAIYALSVFKKDRTLGFWILATVPTFLMFLYPLVALMILPFRPLGRDLFKNP